MENTVHNAPVASAVSITQKQPAGTHRNWSITLNNPTAEELKVWETATTHHWVKEVIGQIERGEAGTEHIQGMLKTVAVRFAQVKKLFPRAHIEVARNTAALQQYVQKDDTRVRTLDPQVSSIQAVTPRSLQDALTLVVMERIYHKGLPLLFQTVVRRLGATEWSEWESDFNDSHLDMHGAEHSCVFGVTGIPVCNMRDNARYLQEHADGIIDDAVKRLIEQGVFGAEYATAQLACRAALKRYIVEICIRNANQREAEYEEEVEREASRRTPPRHEEID